MRVTYIFVILFSRKVYMILMAQLVVTFGMVALFTLSPDVKHFVHATPALFYVALVGTLVCIIALSCCGNLRRRTPHNYIFLGIFTVSCPYIVCFSMSILTEFNIYLSELPGLL